MSRLNSVTRKSGKQTLKAPAVGDKLIVKGAERNGEYTVLGPCENSRNGRWYCVTHGEHFDNQLQKDFHISRGTHSLVWLCFEHGPEVDPKWFE